MDKKDVKIVFMGTPQFAVATLKALVEGGYTIAAVVTQPDKPVGRHQDTPQPTPVKQYAVAHGLPVLQPQKMKDPIFISALAAYEADLQVVVAFRMLPAEVWKHPRFGTFNLHASLLPQYRGAAPINWAIINGERQTGVTTFFLDENIDTGRVILQAQFDIKPSYNAEDVHDGLMELGAQLTLKTIDKIIEGDGHVQTQPQQQMADPTTKLNNAPKIYKDTCRINWESPAQNVRNFIRGLAPHPGAWCDIISQNGKQTTLKIYKATLTNIPCQPRQAGQLTLHHGNLIAATRDQWLQLDELQLSGKRRMSAQTFLNGFRDIESHSLK